MTAKNVMGKNILAWGSMLLCALLLGACAAQPPTAPTPNVTPSLTPVAAHTPTVQPPLPTPAAFVTPPIAAGPPTSWPTVARPTPVSFPESGPTLTPDPQLAESLDQLKMAIALRAETEARGISLKRVSGWPLGLTFRWLDGAHLMLNARLYELGPFAGGPVVINLENGQTWLPLTEGPYDPPLWSAGLQRLISSRGNQIFVYKPDGALEQELAGQAPLVLSPSGLRLLDKFVWRDLASGQAVSFESQVYPRRWELAWSSDETRLFGFCGDTDFLYADTQTGSYTCARAGLGLEDWESASPCLRWVLSDTRVMSQLGLYDQARQQSGVLALIDPANQSYIDVRLAAGIGADWTCSGRVAPNGELLWADCGRASDFRQASFVIDLSSFDVQTIPGNWRFCRWSPDSRFALASENETCDPCFSDWYDNVWGAVGNYALFSIDSGDVYPLTGGPVIGPKVDPSGQWVALLSEDGLTLTMMNVSTRAAAARELARPGVNLMWRPQGDGVVVVADDGSLWWSPQLAEGKVKQLTLPPPVADTGEPDILDIQWSPDGSRIAFVSGPDVYIVSVTGD